MTDEEIMRKAIELAKISGDEGEVPVGAVVTKNGEIIATGRNRRELGKNALRSYKQCLPKTRRVAAVAMRTLCNA